jgi:imidazolonepropionase-like amidohydrolase
MKKFLRFTALFACIFFSRQRVFSQQAQNLIPDSSKYYLLRPYQIFDGKDVLKNTWVLIKGNEIKNVGPSGSFFFPANTVIIDMPNQTLMPGLIDGHTHLFLHLYNEASYETQVMRESGAERVLRAASNARKALMAGFTTVVDMGTLGAGFEDEGLQETIEKGVVSGPRMLIASRGISASGAYSSKGFANETEIPKGAATADGKDDILKEIRNQLGAGADIIYVYCESFGSKGNPATATYTVEELQLIVDLAKSANRIVVANASTPEGIKRAIDAGITFITHADNCTPEL